MRIRDGSAVNLGDAVGQQFALILADLRVGNSAGLVVVAAGKRGHVAFRHGFSAEDGRAQHAVDDAKRDDRDGDDAADHDRLLGFRAERFLVDCRCGGRDGSGCR